MEGKPHGFRPPPVPPFASSPHPAYKAAMERGERIMSKENARMARRLDIILRVVSHAERNGLHISTDTRSFLERQCMEIFDDPSRSEPPDFGLSSSFAAALKLTAVRLFRQRRFQQADKTFRMASLFNQGDPTLLSNRATCMYNRAQYTRCIDMCHTCFFLFEHLMYNKPSLYFKLLVRLARANIELRNFEEAQTIATALPNLRAHLSRLSIQISDAEFKSYSQPLKQHLEAALQNPQNDKPKSASSSFSSRFYIGKDGILHDRDDISFKHFSFSDDNGDVSQSDSDSPPIHIYDFCKHVHSACRGRCLHPPELTDSADEMADGQSSASDIPSLRSDDSDEEDDDLPASSAASSSAHHSMSASSSSKAYASTLNKRYSDDLQESGERASNTVVSASGGPDAERDFSEADNAQPKRRKRKKKKKKKRKNNTDGDHSCPDLPGGCLHSLFENPPILNQAAANALELSFCPTRFATNVSSTDLSERSPASITAPQRNGDATKMYESGDEAVEFLAKLSDVERFADIAQSYILPQNHSHASENSLNMQAIAKRVAQRVLGMNFNAYGLDKISFEHAFGPHCQMETLHEGAMFCHPKCTPCMVRRMWDMRFLSTNADEAHCYLANLEQDSRRDEMKYLEQHYWERSGFFASGFELAFDVPRLVHGVAYLALLQSEVHWSGRTIPPAYCVQRKFIRALEETCRGKDKRPFLFLTLDVLKSTVRVLELMRVQQEKDGITFGDAIEGEDRWWQFSRTAAKVARDAWPSGTASSSSKMSKEAMLLTRSQKFVENNYNWATYGYVQQEEQMIYRMLLRDVASLVVHVTADKRRASRVQCCGARTGASRFSDVFGMACGNDPDNEKYWRTRIVSALYFGRSRTLEERCSEYQETQADWKLVLLDRAVAARPNKARLRLKRGELYMKQGRIQESLTELQRGREIVKKAMETKRVMMETNDEHAETSNAEKFMWFKVHMLLGEAYDTASLSNGASRNEKMEHWKLAIRNYRVGLSEHVGSRKSRAGLSKKIRELYERGIAMKWDASDVLADANGNGLSGRTDEGNSNVVVVDEGITLNETTRKKRKKKRKKKKKKKPEARAGEYEDVQEVRDEIEDDDDDDDGGGVISPNNAYAALAENEGNSSRRREGMRDAKSRNGGASGSVGDSRMSAAEVVEEVRRVCRTEGGEMRVSEILRRLDLSRWGVHDSARYVQQYFGDVHQLCLQHGGFHMRAGSQADPLLVVVGAGSAVGPETMRIARSGRDGRSGRGRDATRGGRGGRGGRGDGRSGGSGRGGQASRGSRGRAGGRGGRGRRGRRSEAEHDIRLSATREFAELVRRLHEDEGRQDYKEEEEEEECGICLDAKPDMRVVPCGHVWCNGCMDDYLQKNNTCPKCRTTIIAVDEIGLD